MTSITTPSTWSLFRKIGFRFLCIYFIQFVLFQNNMFPFWDVIFEKPAYWMQDFVLWMSANVYGFEEPISTAITGSGDTTFDYLYVLTMLINALVGCIIWSVLDRKRPNYEKVHYWLTVAVRYYVALMLISYGLYKVIQLQFPPPYPTRLLSTYGESSPMGIAWTFLGYSYGYNLFMGIAELLAGLLLFRRTKTFGAIITLATVANVMAINYCFDVPVKIVSTHLVLMTIFLLAKDIKPLLSFFFTKTATALEIRKRPIQNRKINIGINSFKVLLVGYVFIYGFYEVWDAQKEYGSDAMKPHLYGAYEVTHCTVNGDTLTNYKDPRLWRNFAVSWPGSLQVRRMADSGPTYFSMIDNANSKNAVLLTNNSNHEEKFLFEYTKGEKTLSFQYVLNGDTIQGQSKRLTDKDFELTSREFHWVNEYPYNR